MKKIILCIICTFCLQSLSLAEKRTVTTYQNIPSPSYSQNSIYNRDLANIENTLFGEIYQNESFISRLNRIEMRLFNRTYSSSNYATRMNNILANYKEDYYYNRNYLPTNKNKTTAQKIIDRFIGYPTGYTPQIVNTPFNDYGYPVGINRGYSSNRGYRYNNYLPPTTGAGIHILD